MEVPVRSILMAGIVLFALIAVDSPSGVVAATAERSAFAGDPVSMKSTGAWGIDLSDRDASIKAGDNFYMSQNGAWFARTIVGDNLPNAAYWRDLRRLAPMRVVALLEKIAAEKDLSSDTVAGKAAAFYRAFMDEAAVAARGVAPLKPDLDLIRAAMNRKRLAHLMGAVAGPGTNRPVNYFSRALGPALWGVDIAQDKNRPDHYAVYLHQAGLLLPGPEFYLDPGLTDMRAGYERYVARVLALLDWPQAQLRAEQIVAFETRIARVSWSHEQMDNVGKTNNPMTVRELMAYAPEFDWRTFLAGAELARVDKVIVDAKGAFPLIASVYAHTPIEILQARQAFALADANADALDMPLYLEKYAFRTKQLAGQGNAAPPSRSMRAEFALSTHIDEILGSLYAARHFSPEAKAEALKMAGNLRTALDRRLAQLHWMTDSTKLKSRSKLAKMRVHVGYPDDPQDYKGLLISDTDLHGDMRRSDAYKWRRDVRLLNAPFQHNQWSLTADYPNYSYVQTTNTLELPAALLQPPFFDIKADMAVNYGAIGTLIGEMMMAAFDAQGRHYDENGRFGDWWAPAEVACYDAQVHRLSAQYSAVEALPGLRINGDLVVNESVDDLGGVLIGLEAYRIALDRRSPPVLDGFTGEQRYFLGRAQMWRAKFSTNFIRNQIATGMNAPPLMRVNGPVRNVDAWYTAFEVQPGDKLYLAPEERVRLW